MNKVKEGTSVGTRYWRIVSLAAFALKSGIPFEQLEKDAMDLIPFMNSIENAQHNKFTTNDVRTALKVYNDDKTYRMTSKYISAKTGIEIKKNKRNGRKQKNHLKMIRKKQKRNLKKGINC